jgi:hypothetical protein
MLAAPFLANTVRLELQAKSELDVPFATGCRRCDAAEVTVVLVDRRSPVLRRVHSKLLKSEKSKVRVGGPTLVCRPMLP